MPQPEPAARPPGRRLPGQVLTCGWCGSPIAVPARGRVPKWCGPTCRHRAWEQRGAAASGLAAVEVVTHRVEVSAPAPAVPQVAPRSVADWSRLLDDLARKLDAGRIYDRDLPALNEALTDVIDAFNRRLRVQDGASGHRLDIHSLCR